jgi:hypothetical protein
VKLKDDGCSVVQEVGRRVKVVKGRKTQKKVWRR